MIVKAFFLKNKQKFIPIIKSRESKLIGISESLTVSSWPQGNGGREKKDSKVKRVSVLLTIGG